MKRKAAFQDATGNPRGCPAVEPVCGSDTSGFMDAPAEHRAKWDLHFSHNLEKTGENWAFAAFEELKEHFANLLA